MMNFEWIVLFEPDHDGMKLENIEYKTQKHKE